VAAATFGVVTPRQQPEDFKALRRLFEEETAAAVDFDHAPGIQRRTP
jgi:hypothetical protein